MPVRPVSIQPPQANVAAAISALRFEIVLVRRALVLRRIKAGFNPDQPRDEQGRWSGGGTSAVSAQRRRGGLGRFPNATPGEAAGLAAAEARANAAIARAQAVDPNFRPSPSFSETIQGETTARLSEAREAEAHVRAIETYHANRPAIERLMPGGREVGEQLRGASDNIRTLSSERFKPFVDFVLRDASELESYPRYEGRAFRLPDSSIVGLRYSRDHGETLDVLQSNHPIIENGYKVHQR